ncbi:MAG TPA: sugar ABC transporter ATP-binding protein [Capillimicrobium sp.]|nr:sugar ABC transporter ATP-binding protein [Capillimicrobium sp.]
MTTPEQQGTSGLGTAPPPGGAAPAVEFRGISKAFGGTQALSDVTMTVEPGTVHALIGQNGAGKSTMVKILAGFHDADDGELWLNGERMALPLHQQDARRHGLGFFHQNIVLAPELSILENVRVNRFNAGSFGRIHWSREREDVRERLADVDLHVDPDMLVAALPQAQRALVGFVRAVQSVREDHELGNGVLVLDEPTAYLPRASVDRLYAATRRLVDQGAAAIFVSHRLDEVMRFADRISVIRGGRMVATLNRDETSVEELVRLILGRELGGMYPTKARTVGDEVLSVDGLSGKVVRGVSFGLARGEILGLTGLVGMGHEEVPYLIAGATKAEDGTVAVDGNSIAARDLTPRSSRELRIGFLPGDRERESGVPTATVTENVTMPVLGQFFSGGRLKHRKERDYVGEIVRRFNVQPPHPELPLAALSGGNQQKALMAKWLQLEPLVQLMYEPTQGVDIGSRRQMFQFIEELARSGAGVVIASSEYEDLANICTRVLVFRDGRAVAELTGASLTKDSITEQCLMSVDSGT